MKDIAKYIIFGAAIATGALTVSCSDEVTEEGVYDMNYIYFRPPLNTSGSIKYKPANNDEGFEIYEGGGVLYLPRIRCTKPASQDIRVTLGFNEDMLAQYNAEHTRPEMEGEDSWKGLPRARFEPSEMLIPAGAYESTDSVRVYLEPGDFFDEQQKKFALPVNISTTSNGKVAPHDNGFVYTFQTSQSLITVETKENGTTRNFICPKGEKMKEQELDLGSIIRISENLGTALEDYNVKLEIDANAYSLGHPYSTYAALTSNIELLTDNVTIRAGESESSSVKLNMKAEAFESMTAGETYVIPLKLTEVSGKGSALTIQYGKTAYGIAVSWSYETNTIVVSSAAEIGGSKMESCGIAHAYPAYSFDSSQVNIFQGDKAGQLRGEDIAQSWYYWEKVYYIELTEECDLTGFEMQFESIYYLTKFDLYVNTMDNLEVYPLTFEDGETVIGQSQSPTYFKFKQPVQAKCIKIVPKESSYDNCTIKLLQFYK